MIEPNRSPFGGEELHIRSLDVEALRSMYIEKCGYDPERHFNGLTTIDLFECQQSGMRYWKPSSVAGDEDFYASLSKLWPNYYKKERWEYDGARDAVRGPTAKVLEVGCGRGYFLKSLEGIVASATGLELNQGAIAGKVTRFEVHAMMVHEHAQAMAGEYDSVCSFQVLEHVEDPMGFLRESARLVRRGGKLVVSTPNYDFPVHSRAADAFDLPPHHLNHFTPRVFERIAKVLNLELISTHTEKRVEARFKVRMGDEHSKLQRLIRSRLNKTVGRLSEQETAGHTVLAIYQIP